MKPEYNLDSQHYIAGMLSNKDLSSDDLLKYNLVSNLDLCSDIMKECEPYYFNIFIKGYLDSMKCKLNLHELKLYISEKNRLFVKYPYHDCGEYILLTGTNLIDFLGDIYPIRHLTELFPTVVCKFNKSVPEAVTPTKVRLSDVGYDLTVIKEHKKLNSVTSLYDTGIKMTIEPHFYIEVVPRSSLSKSGYMLSNSMGIIDPGYTDNIYVALTKVDPHAPPITFPFKCCQLIIRPVYQAVIEESVSGLESTHRGEGGFGSTG